MSASGPGGGRTGQCLQFLARFCGLRCVRTGFVRTTMLRIRRKETHKGFRSIRHVRVMSVLGYRPVRVVQDFMSDLIDTRITQYYRTNKYCMTILCRFLLTINIAVSGVVCDICCGLDESIAHAPCRAFPDMSRLLLK